MARNNSNKNRRRKVVFKGFKMAEIIGNTAEQKLRGLIK